MAVGVADVLGLGERDRAFEHVERRSRVATREPDEVIEGLVGRAPRRRPAPGPGQTALLVLERAPDDRRDVVVGQRLEAPDAHPRQQRGIHLEVRVLGRRPDQRDRAVLDVRQQRVLLRLVEPMDLVEEQDGARAVQGEPFLGLGDRRADIGDAGHDRATSSRTPPRSRPRATGRGSSCRSRAVPTAAATRDGRGRSPGGAARARRRGAPVRRTRRGVRGRIRAASGWRSGGGWKSASGRAPPGAACSACRRWYRDGRADGMLASRLLGVAGSGGEMRYRRPPGRLQIARCPWPGGRPTARAGTRSASHRSWMMRRTSRAT